MVLETISARAANSPTVKNLSILIPPRLLIGIERVLNIELFIVFYLSRLPDSLGKHPALGPLDPWSGNRGRRVAEHHPTNCCGVTRCGGSPRKDRKSTRLNSSH